MLAFEGLNQLKRPTLLPGLLIQVVSVTNSPTLTSKSAAIITYECLVIINRRLMLLCSCSFILDQMR